MVLYVDTGNRVSLLLWPKLQPYWYNIAFCVDLLDFKIWGNRILSVLIELIISPWKLYLLIYLRLKSWRYLVQPGLTKFAMYISKPMQNKLLFEISQESAHSKPLSSHVLYLLLYSTGSSDPQICAMSRKFADRCSLFPVLLFEWFLPRPLTRGIICLRLNVHVGTHKDWQWYCRGICWYWRTDSDEIVLGKWPYLGPYFVMDGLLILYAKLKF